MPAKDIYHDTVKRALIEDGWTITKENLPLRWGVKYTYVDKRGGETFYRRKRRAKNRG